MSSTDVDGLQLLLDYRDGFLVSKTMFAACELGVFDLLHDVGKPISSTAIASHLAMNMDGTDQLLSACVGLKLLKAVLKGNEAYYSITDVSAAYLAKKSPKSLYYTMMHYSKSIYPCINFLPEAVREGDNQYKRAFGIHSKEIFEALYRSEEAMLHFMQCMDSTVNLFGKDVIQAFDLSEFHAVCDLGGCSGALAKTFLSSYPCSTVTIMDLPKVVQMAKKYFVTNDEQGISFLEGDFFNGPIPEADLYTFSRIIHDWSDDTCLQLLKKVYQSCRPGGAVLIMEAILNEDKSGPVSSQLMSLLMLVQAEGKERTSTEYAKLLTGSGFKDVQFRAAGKESIVIMGRK